MKPGSSDRCKSKHPTRDLRCNRTSKHDDLHQAKSGKTTVRWADSK